VLPESCSIFICCCQEGHPASKNLASAIFKGFPDVPWQTCGTIKIQKKQQQQQQQSVTEYKFFRLTEICSTVLVRDAQSRNKSLQCFDTVGWATGRASRL